MKHRSKFTRAINKALDFLVPATDTGVAKGLIFTIGVVFFLTIGIYLERSWYNEIKFEYIIHAVELSALGWIINNLSKSKQ